MRVRMLFAIGLFCLVGCQKTEFRAPLCEAGVQPPSSLSGRYRLPSVSQDVRYSGTLTFDPAEIQVSVHEDGSVTIDVPESLRKYVGLEAHGTQLWTRFAGGQAGSSLLSLERFCYYGGIYYAMSRTAAQTYGVNRLDISSTGLVMTGVSVAPAVLERSNLQRYFVPPFSGEGGTSILVGGPRMVIDNRGVSFDTIAPLLQVAPFGIVLTRIAPDTPKLHTRTTQLRWRPTGAP